MRRTFISLTLAVVLMLLALPVVAAPATGPAWPGSLIGVAVLDAFVDFWGMVTASEGDVPAQGMQAKDGDDDRDDPPLDELGPSIIPNG